MDRSSRFGSRSCDYFALFRLAFATATPHGLTSPHDTNSQVHSSKGTQSQDCSRSYGLYANGFRFYFTPLSGFFSPFPHGTCPLSVTREYLDLAGGPARFTRDFSGPVLLGILRISQSCFDYRGVTFCAGSFQILHLQH